MKCNTRWFLALMTALEKRGPRDRLGPGRAKRVRGHSSRTAAARPIGGATGLADASTDSSSCCQRPAPTACTACSASDTASGGNRAGSRYREPAAPPPPSTAQQYLQYLQSPPEARQVAYFNVDEPRQVSENSLMGTQDASLLKQPSTQTPEPVPPGTGGPVGLNGGCVSAPICGAPCCTLIAAAEATFFWPQFHRNFLTAAVDNGNGVQAVQTNAALGSTDGSLLVAPRISLGLQGPCWGIVARYWNASSWATGFAPASPALAAPGVTSFDGFQAYTADLELQRRFCCDCWTFYGFGGVRYAGVQNDRSLVVTSVANGNYVSASSLADQQFFGTGLTFGVYGTRWLCCCDGPWQLYFANRYSTLWGNSGAVTQTGAVVADGASSSAVNGAAAKAPASLFIGEVQLGLQWTAQLCWLPGRAFVRGGVEWQYWDASTAVNTRATSVAFSATPGSLNAAAGIGQAGDLLFNLVGFTVGAGIMY